MKQEDKGLTKVMLPGVVKANSSLMVALFGDTKRIKHF
jgi:hypothetical protein